MNKALKTYCFISMEYPPETGLGGIGTHVWHMARVLQQKGIQVTVFSCSFKQDQDYIEDGIRIIRKRLHEPRLITWYLKVTWFLISNKFDVVEDGEFLGSCFLYQIFFKKKGDFIHVKLHTCHQIVNYYENKFTPFQKLKTGIINFIERGNAIRADLITAPSIIIKQISGILWNIPEYKIQILHNTFSIPIEDNKIEKVNFDYILYFGRLQERKGADMMLELIKNDFLHGNDLQFILIGGDYFHFKDKLKLIKNETTDRVQVIDHISDRRVLFSYIKSAKAVFLPSKFESFGLTILESLWFNTNTFVLNNSGPLEIMSTLGLYELILDGNLILNKNYFISKVLISNHFDLQMIRETINKEYGYDKVFIELMNILKKHENN